MSSSEAIRLLKMSGWKIARNGKGDHLVMEKNGERIVLSNGKKSISPGMAGKVRSAARSVQ